MVASVRSQVGVSIREEVFQTLFDFMDADGDGDISYPEFARVVSAEDIMIMAPVSQYGAVS